MGVGFCFMSGMIMVMTAVDVVMIMGRIISLMAVLVPVFMGMGMRMGVAVGFVTMGMRMVMFMRMFMFMIMFMSVHFYFHCRLLFILDQIINLSSYGQWAMGIL